MHARTYSEQCSQWSGSCSGRPHPRSIAQGLNAPESMEAGGGGFGVTRRVRVKASVSGFRFQVSGLEFGVALKGYSEPSGGRVSALWVLGWGPRGASEVCRGSLGYKGSWGLMKVFLRACPFGAAAVSSLGVFP